MDYPSQWRHNEHDGVSNNRRLDCLLNCLFRRRSKETSKLRVTSLCEGNSPVTVEFPAQRASNGENISIWWRHHATVLRMEIVPLVSNFKYYNVYWNQITADLWWHLPMYARSFVLYLEIDHCTHCLQLYNYFFFLSYTHKKSIVCRRYDFLVNKLRHWIEIPYCIQF